MAQPQSNAPHPFSLKRAILMGVFAYLVWLGGNYVYDRFFKSEEDKIRDLLQSAVDGANNKSPREVTRILAEDFKGPEGATKDLIHQWLVQVLMMQYRVIETGLEPQPVPVTLEPGDRNRASAVFRVHARGKADGAGEWEIIQERYNAEQNISLKATFRKTPDGWRMDGVDLAKGAP